jgi:hypothetical protein
MLDQDLGAGDQDSALLPRLRIEVGGGSKRPHAAGAVADAVVATRRWTERLLC